MLLVRVRPYSILIPVLTKLGCAVRTPRRGQFGVWSPQIVGHWRRPLHGAERLACRLFLDLHHVLTFAHPVAEREVNQIVADAQPEVAQEASAAEVIAAEHGPIAASAKRQAITDFV